MNEEFDFNEVIAGVADRQIERVAGRLTDEAKKVTASVRSSFRRTYSAYLKRILARYSRGKSFLLGNQPVPLYDFFVPLDLDSGSACLKSASLRDLASRSAHSVIVGTGGCGKSVLMRHMLVGCVEDGTKIPVFLELRDLNDRAMPPDLKTALLNCLEQYNLKVDMHFVDAVLKSGDFCLLLDGFDEVSFGRRKDVVKAIERLTTKYPDNWVVLTSRPDTDLRELADFVHYSIAPLSLEQAVQLVKKLPFDSELKQRFTDDLSSLLYEKHESFLSNPLLLSIMLLTYQDAAHIPNKLNLFYAGAFEALFQKHDAWKGAYTRERHTSLDMQDFGTVFSGFSLVTYDKRQFTFSKVEALDFVKKAAPLTPVGTTYDYEGFLEDCMQAVCLIVEDGLSLSFAHRSFQEYFTARYMAACEDGLKRQLIAKYAVDLAADSVLDLLWEMDQEGIERHYVLPNLATLRELVGYKQKVGITHFLRFLKTVLNEFETLPDAERFFVDVARDGRVYWNLMFFIGRRYFPDVSSPPEAESRVFRKRMAKYIVKASPSGPSKRDDMYHVPVRSLKTTDEVVTYLARSTEWPSINGLQNVLSLYDEIVGRHARLEASLTELLASEVVAE